MSGNGLVSSPGEFHPEALAEPYVNVSAHTAPIIQPGKGTPRQFGGKSQMKYC